MSDQEREFASYGLVMPFVICQSNGGPFEDQAFVAGWRCGEIDRCLRMADGVKAEMMFTVRADELSQLDLIAMHRGFVMEKGDEDAEGDSWVIATFRRSAPKAGADDA